VSTCEVAVAQRRPCAIRRLKCDNFKVRNTHFRASTHTAPAHRRRVSLMLFVDVIRYDPSMCPGEGRVQKIRCLEYRSFRALGYGFGGVRGGAAKHKPGVTAHILRALTSILGVQVSINYRKPPYENCKIISLHYRERDAQTRDSFICRQRYFHENKPQKVSIISETPSPSAILSENGITYNREFTVCLML